MDGPVKLLKAGRSVPLSVFAAYAALDAAMTPDHTRCAGPVSSAPHCRGPYAVSYGDCGCCLASTPRLAFRSTASEYVEGSVSGVGYGLWRGNSLYLERGLLHCSSVVNVSVRQHLLTRVFS